MNLQFRPLGSSFFIKSNSVLMRWPPKVSVSASGRPPTPSTARLSKRLLPPPPPPPPPHPQRISTKHRTFLVETFHQNQKLKSLLHKIQAQDSDPLQPPPHPQRISTKHRTFLVETFHQNQKLKSLLHKIQAQDSDPLQLLRDEGDWSKEQFWAVIRFLKETGRMDQALQVFNFWKDIEKSRNNEVNYMKIVELLGKSGLMEEATSMLQEMKMYGLSPSVEIYNSIVHGFAQKGDFENARLFLKNMVENNIMPEPETYDGLIHAFGNYRMYDEMCKCVKKMESDGCSPDHVTYNILIMACAQGGLLEKMEGVYQTLLSKRMVLQSSTLVAMLEAYVNFGIVEKMEKIYRRILNSKIFLKEELIRKMTRVYLENYRFSRLEELGQEIALKTGKTYLVWCLLLLSSACLLSHKGMQSVIQEMEVAKVRPHVTYTNIIALALLKMKDLRHLDMLLCRLQAQNVKPDIVTVGVGFDAFFSGLGRTKALDVWRRMGILNEEVKLNTDPLVLTAFGKGFFLRSSEKLYSSLGAKGREKKIWTYNDLIDLILKQNGRKSQFMLVNQD